MFHKLICTFSISILILIFNASFPNFSIATIFTEEQVKALNIIGDFAERMCKNIPLEGHGRNLELKGSAKAELNGIISELVNLGMDGAVKYQNNYYEGLLQNDLVGALKDSTNCKLQIWKDLKDKLIIPDIPPVNEYLSKYQHRPVKLENPLTQGVKNELEKSIDKALTHYDMGIISYNDSNFDIAIKHFDVALEIIQIPSFILAKGNSFLSISNYIKAETLYNEALRGFRRISDTKKEAITLQYIGIIQKDMGELGLSLNTLKIALTITEENKFEEEKASCLNIIGLIYKDQGNYTEAYKKINEAYKISDKNKFFQVKADSLGNIGLLKMDEGDFYKALTDQQEALSIYQKINYSLGEARSQGSIGLVFRKMGDLNKAEYHFNEALVIFNKIGYQLGIAESKGNIGLIYMDKNDFNNALKLLKEALEINRKIKYKLGEAMALKNISIFYNKKQEYDKSKEYDKLSKEILERIGAKF